MTTDRARQRACVACSGQLPCGGDWEAIHFDFLEVGRRVLFDILKTRPTQTKYLPCDTRLRTEWSFRVGPDD
jgi:hypothetical protein